LAAVAWLSLAAVAWSDGVMMNGVSPRSISRGGTNLGFFDNGGILYDNPAAMVNVEGCGLMELGVDTIIVSGHYADVDNNVYSTTGTPLPQFGIIQKSDDGCWAYGMGVFTPAGFCERYSMQGPVPLASEQRYESFGALVKIPVGVACRVTDRLSVGASAEVTAAWYDYRTQTLERLRQNAGDLCPLLQDFPDTKFVLMHIGYPYQDEFIALAKHYPNAYVDMCWAWIINPAASVRFLKEFLLAAPASKLFPFGGDYVSVECVYGHCRIARQGITQALSELVDEGWIALEETPALIERILRGNAHEIFPQPR
jgi:hypothetical protein